MNGSLLRQSLLIFLLSSYFSEKHKLNLWNTQYESFKNLSRKFNFPDEKKQFVCFIYLFFNIEKQIRHCDSLEPKQNKIKPLWFFSGIEMFPSFPKRIKYCTKGHEKYLFETSLFLELGVAGSKSSIRRGLHVKMLQCCQICDILDRNL